MCFTSKQGSFLLWIKPLCHPEYVWSRLTFSSEHPLCHEVLKQTLMGQTITCVFPDRCIYTKHWLQFSLATLTHVSFKGSGGSACVGFLLMTSSHAQPVADCYHKLLPVYSPRLSFFQSLGNSGGGGARQGLNAGITIHHIRYSESGGM